MNLPTCSRAGLCGFHVSGEFSHCPEARMPAPVPIEGGLERPDIVEREIDERVAGPYGP